MTAPEKKLCVDCGKRPRWYTCRRCYACHCIKYPEWAALNRKRAREKYKNDTEWAARKKELDRERNRERYRNDFEYREQSQIRSYLSKCKIRGRLNNE